jgi:hypothetical protein
MLGFSGFVPVNRDDDAGRLAQPGVPKTPLSAVVLLCRDFHVFLTNLDLLPIAGRLLEE